MVIPTHISDQFMPLVSHVKQTHIAVRSSGAAVVVIYKDRIVTEEYWGRHTQTPSARPIQQDSQFHVASVRKSYIGFTVGYAVYHGLIQSIDDPVSTYLHTHDAGTLDGTTIRHLLTHTPGLRLNDGSLVREFPSGQGWAYRNVGVDMLTQIVQTVTGNTVSGIVSEQVLRPLNFTCSGWYSSKRDSHVSVIREDNAPHWETSNSTDGDKMNMYVSARELAYWGYLHLKRGRINGQQVVSENIIDTVTSMHSPRLPDPDLPQNGFLWFVKQSPAKRTEIGDLVPAGSYQILGYTGVSVLVVPQYDVVAVRMFNRWGSPQGYDYLEDIRSFGDCLMSCF